MLRPDKRPRPMVLRMNVDDCLEVRFQNLLAPTPSVFSPNTGTQRYPVRVPGSTYSPNQNARVAQGAQTTFTESAGQPATRLAGVHAMGMELVKAETPPGTPAAGSAADGSWVGANDVAPVDPQVRASGLVSPGAQTSSTPSPPRRRERICSTAPPRMSATRSRSVDS